MKINRTNWKDFCQEPPLTAAELVEWRGMCSVTVQDDAVFTFIEEKTEMEWAEAYKTTTPSEDWSDMVERSDANRRLQRAEIKAWRLWKESVEFNPAYADIAMKRLGGS